MKKWHYIQASIARVQCQRSDAGCKPLYRYWRVSEVRLSAVTSCPKYAALRRCHWALRTHKPQGVSLQHR